ncbi:hypothetical protein Lnau_0212 [Legionella nautarum]|uniref:Uncharacterized protein n=1 Tax=Legionella nautarum TaxID=45070 RepID=A0A0W0X3K5_9GAMM|nr:hypothetical protein [Legionella nautarum]KTD39143.1 hypothetical protein Lnau_0212 [Legionella nautarum]
MKLLPVCIRNDWLYENTRRQKFREMGPKDVLSISKKTFKTVPLLAIATAGMSKGLATQGISLLNYSMQILKQAHTGIANVGKNKDCSFYQEIDFNKLEKLAEMVDAHPELPYAKLWLVTDADLPVVNRGILLYSRTEAVRFVEMYNSLEDYTQSDFYKYKGISIQIKDSDLPIFEEELLNYLKVRENRLWSQLIKMPEVLDEHFTDELVTSEDSEPAIIQINFPEAVSQKALEKYFPGTLKCLVTEEEKKQAVASKDKLQSTAIYEALASYADEWTDSETEDDSIEESVVYGDEIIDSEPEDNESTEEEKYEQKTAAGKEKPISYLHRNRGEVVATRTTTVSAQPDLTPQARGNLTKESATQSSSIDSDLYPQAGGGLVKKSALAQSMSKGVFKTKEKATPSDELARAPDSDSTFKY